MTSTHPFIAFLSTSTTATVLPTQTIIRAANLWAMVGNGARAVLPGHGLRRGQRSGSEGYNLDAERYSAEGLESEVTEGPGLVLG